MIAIFFAISERKVLASWNLFYEWSPSFHVLWPLEERLTPFVTTSFFCINLKKKMDAIWFKWLYLGHFPKTWLCVGSASFYNAFLNFCWLYEIGIIISLIDFWFVCWFFFYETVIGFVCFQYLNYDCRIYIR